VALTTVEAAVVRPRQLEAGEPLLHAALEAVLVDGGDERTAAEEQRDQADADGEPDGRLVVVVVAIASIEIAPPGARLASLAP
jgi:hypothetical protein